VKNAKFFAGAQNGIGACLAIVTQPRAWERTSDDRLNGAKRSNGLNVLNFIPVPPGALGKDTTGGAGNR
jgi:hypothetical protein